MTANYEKVTQGLKMLQEALGPFAHRELAARFGGRWWTDGVLPALSDQQRRELPASGSAKEYVDQLDVAALLAVVNRNWDQAFRDKLTRDDRTYVNELISTRNKWAHHGSGDMPTDDAWRALDTMARLLEHTSPPTMERIQAFAKEVREAQYAPKPSTASRPRQDAPHPPTPSPQAETRPRGEVPLPPSPPAERGPGGEVRLRPWRDVATPHPDVATGRYQQAEFAADLAQVLSGRAEAEYGDPTEFFRRTFITEGMRRLLVTAVERLAGKGGEPVVQLKTAFGGGKTHTMLALYHLFRSPSPPAERGSGGEVRSPLSTGGAVGRGSEVHRDELPGVRTILDAAAVAALPRGSVAVLVGTALNPTQAHLDAAGRGVRVRTLWGELAAQLGGKDGYELVRAADETGVAPGADTLVELFEFFGPCLILIDELVAYCRNIYGVAGLPAGSFDSNMTFVQSLTEAARRSKNGMVVASIPASDIEIGGEGGQAALERIENTFGRLEAVWKPVGALEGFEIVRRRLFLPVARRDRPRSRLQRLQPALF